MIREALASYVTRQHELAPPPNPLLGLIGLGSSAAVMDLSDGGDKYLLRQKVNPVCGWSVSRDSDL